jgi:hypothetical protein
VLVTYVKDQHALEKAEVSLCNLQRLGELSDDGFGIEFDDIMVTLKTSIELLQSSQDDLLVLYTYDKNN